MIRQKQRTVIATRVHVRLVARATRVGGAEGSLLLYTRYIIRQRKGKDHQIKPFQANKAYFAITTLNYAGEKTQF